MPVYAPSFNASQLQVSGQRNIGLALAQCMSLGVLSLVNPATGAADDLKNATATTVAIQTWTAADLKSAGITKLALHGARKVTFVTAGGTAAHAPATCLITGTATDDSALSETLALSQIAGTATSVKCYKTIVSVVFAVGDGTGATIGMGIADTFGLPSAIKTRGSIPVYLLEMVDGDVVSTGGASTTAVNTTTIAANVTAVATNQTTVATNQTTVATNQTTVATNQAGVTGATVDNGTATNVALALAGQSTFVAPIAAELISIVAAVQITDVALTIIAQPDYPRNLQIRMNQVGAAVTGGICTLIGVGADGSAVTEVIDCTGGTKTEISTLGYATLTSATVSGLIGGGGGTTIGIGVGPGLALPIPVGAAAVAVAKTVMDEADETVAGVDAAARVVTPTTAPNAAHDYHFFYNYTLTGTQNAHTHALTDAGHNHTQDTHNHTQDTHNHTQDTHNHTQDTHNHTQSTHNHAQTAHTHAGSEATVTVAATALPFGDYTPATTPNGALDYLFVYEQVGVSQFGA